MGRVADGKTPCIVRKTIILLQRRPADFGTEISGKKDRREGGEVGGLTG